MKRIAFIILSLSLALAVQAQEKDRFPRTCKTPAAQEANFRNSIWYNSQNKAGLAFSPVEEYNYLDLRYDMTDGKFRPQTTGSSSHNVSLNTSGAIMLGKFMVMGAFSFRNRFEKGAMYNTALYDVVYDMPFFILDAQESGWNKQEYDLSATLVSPIVADRISFGLDVRYLTKVGAKQRDPRSETYKYNVEVIPSIVIRPGGRHFIGIHGLFDNQFERSQPSLNNYKFNQEVTYNKGLGEGILGVVGGNGGVKTLYYKGMRYGGGLQYAYDGKASVLAEFQYLGRRVLAYENPNLPQRLGATRNAEISAKVQVIFGQSRSNKFTLHALKSGTDGIEFVQKLITEAHDQRWELLKENKMTRFEETSAVLDYDHLFGNDPEQGYDWKVGGNVSLSMMDQLYRHPKSTFNVLNTGFSVNGGKQVKFKTSTLLIALQCGYHLNLGGDYKYGGNKTGSHQVAYYEKENNYLTADFVKAGARISYTYNARKVNYFIDLQGDWIQPLSIKEHRALANLSLGIVF